MRRIYEPTQFLVAKQYVLGSNTSHHLIHVLRADCGEIISLFNGYGGEFKAKIISMDKKRVSVLIQEFISREVVSPLKIHLGQGIARGEKMDLIIQKSVELGVAEITPLFTERCNVQLDAERTKKRLEHWQAVIISACEQSGRNDLPLLHPPLKLASWLAQLHTQTRFCLLPHESTAPLCAMAEKEIALLIGPEGGFSPNEEKLATDYHCTSLNLGPRILRTETASLAAIAALQFCFGDGGGALLAR